MRETRIIMGMPVTVEIIGDTSLFQEVFSYFTYVDEKFSTYKSTSEITAINEGRLAPADYSDDMKEIFRLSEKTKNETDGYFDIVNREGKYDPSGLVKGWAICNAGKILQKRGALDFFIDAGGDIQTSGKNAGGRPWNVGIADPFDTNYGGTVSGGIVYGRMAEKKMPSKVVKVLQVSGGEGVATSGTSIRGQHIYNPHKKNSAKNVKKNDEKSDGEDGIHDIVSLTVIGPDIYEADRFATAAFAMGKSGIHFIENLRVDGRRFEGYMIDRDGIAVMTSGFQKYTV